MESVLQHIFAINPDVFRLNVSRVAPPIKRIKLGLFWLRQALATVVLVGLITLLRWWLLERFGIRASYIGYLPLVAFAATYQGNFACVFTLLLSALSATWMKHLDTGFHDVPGDRIGLAIFMLTGLYMLWLVRSLRATGTKLLKGREQFSLTQQELFSEKIKLTDVRMKIAAIVDSSADAIISTDSAGIIDSWNTGAQKIFGYTAAEMLGRPLASMVGPENALALQQDLDLTLKGESIGPCEVIRTTRDGRVLEISLTAFPIFDAGGSVTGSARILRDITESCALARQLQQSQKMDAVGQLTGGIAHDFNNLLAIILGSLDLIEAAGPDWPMALKRCNTAQSAALRAADLTRRLLALSSKQDPQSGPIDLNSSVQNIIRLAGHVLGPEVAIRENLYPTDLEVIADPGGLESALLNLAINARDAMPKGGTISIGTSVRQLDESQLSRLNLRAEPGTYACVEVTDDGIGMSAETLVRVFEPFFTTKERGRGTGLGLSMVYGFVKQSSGGLRINSEVGHGTTVLIYLPLSQQPAAALIPPATPDIVHHSGNILIVDDEADLRDIIAILLEQMGYTVLTACDGRSALDIVQDGGIQLDLVITDVLMGGGMDGVELAQKILALRPGIKIMYSSGFPAGSRSARSLALADSHVLQKPYSMSELSEMVVRTLAVT